MDAYSGMQQKERVKEKRQKKADRLLTVPPGMALPKSGAGLCTTEQLDLVHQVLIETDDQVPPDATRPIIEPPQQLISPLPMLQVLPISNPLLAPTDMPADIMEQEEAVPEKQAGWKSRSHLPALTMHP